MRECGFCGRRADTKEDAWPVWMMKLISGNAIGVIERHVMGKDSIHFRDRSVKVGRVCRRHCNNGWMSDLENEAKPILTPLILGHPLNLTPPMQVTVALWCTKTAMVFDLTRADSDFYFTAEDRRALFSALTNRLTPALPSHARVWLSSYSGELAATCSIAKMLGFARERPGEKPTPIVGHVATISAGHFVSQLLTPELAPTSLAITPHAKPGPWADVTRQIWPLGTAGSSVSMPPPRFLDDKTLTDLVNRWTAQSIDAERVPL
jgi:hypothetical protein